MFACVKTVCCLCLICFVLVLYTSSTHSNPHTQIHKHTHTQTTYWLHLKYPLCYLTLERKPLMQKHCTETVPIYMNSTLCILYCMKADAWPSSIHFGFFLICVVYLFLFFFGLSCADFTTAEA